MAYYGSGFSELGPNGYYPVSYCSGQNFYQAGYSVACSGKQLFWYDPPPYHVIGYSVSSCCQPERIEHDPAARSEFQDPTDRIIISYSTSDFNEPEFTEYDPTPYGGGYDIKETYGEPLPPSEEICYPRSHSSDVLPSGNGKVEESTAKPQVGGLPVATGEEDHQVNDGAADQHDDESEQSLSEESKEDHFDSSYPGSDSPGGRGDGYSGNLGYISMAPPGYGLETVDLCESLFGYWPCLARFKRSEYDRPGVVDEERNADPWQDCADYLFGSSCPYGKTAEELQRYPMF